MALLRSAEGGRETPLVELPVAVQVASDALGGGEQVVRAPVALAIGPGVLHAGLLEHGLVVEDGVGVGKERDEEDLAAPMLNADLRVVAIQVDAVTRQERGHVKVGATVEPLGLGVRVSQEEIRRCATGKLCLELDRHVGQDQLFNLDLDLGELFVVCLDPRVCGGKAVSAVPGHVAHGGGLVLDPGGRTALLPRHPASGQPGDAHGASGLHQQRSTTESSVWVHACSISPASTILFSIQLARNGAALP